MTEEAKELRREYNREKHKEWRDKNKAKIKKYNAEYWERKVQLAKENEKRRKERSGDNNNDS
jgi:hypothetical protein